MFTVIKGNESREVTIDPKHADAEMPIFGFAFALMAGGGGKIRLL